MPTLLQQPSFGKRDKKYTLEKHSIFNKWFWLIYISSRRRMKLNSEWTKDLNIRPDILDLLGDTLQLTDTGKAF